LRTVDRGPLWIVQTPQAFEYNVIVGAHEKARAERFGGTDDASLVERLGIPVRVIEGSRLNFKITTPEDLTLGEALLKYLK
jgi:2-C-methyl-D-erythritol 4-phosphate cytidylyltransferase